MKHLQEATAYIYDALEHEAEGHRDLTALAASEKLLLALMEMRSALNEAIACAERIEEREPVSFKEFQQC